MTDTLLYLFSTWGNLLVLAVTFFSCLAAPLPASLVMLAGGAFAGAGDVSLLATGGVALSGAVLGDQTGFAIGKRAQSRLQRWSERSKKTAGSLEKAKIFMQNHGARGLFLSRWLFSPLGPYVNVLAGATQVRWQVFTLWTLIGEAVWVSLYVGLGYGLSDQIETLASLSADLTGAFTAAVLAVAIAVWLLRRRTA
jgi:membrane-associated protein